MVQNFDILSVARIEFGELQKASPLTQPQPAPRTNAVTRLPSIAQIRVGPASVTPGESFNVIVRFTEEGAGVKPQNFNTVFTWQNNNDIQLRVDSPPAVLATGEYSYKVAVSGQRPSGTYTLGANGCIYVRDNADNSGCARLPSALRVQITDNAPTTPAPQTATVTYDTEAVLTYSILPEYSDDGRKGRIQGIVELAIIVKADGTVDFQNIRKSLGYGLDERAIEAVKKWKYLPAKKDGVPVASLVTVSVNFLLR